MSETSMAAANRTGNAFIVDAAKCTGCGLCVADCPAEMLALSAGKAAVKPGDEENCIGCQHCLAICPEAAVSVLGLKPEDSRPLKSFKPDYANLKLLAEGRRSVRKFSPEPVELEVVRELVHAAAYAPTGVNAQACHFSVVHSPKAMADYRDRSCLALLAIEDKLPEASAWLAGCAREWVDNGKDEVYRGAPHLLVVSTGPGAYCAKEDALIAMTYFELLAQARGLGAVFAGIPFGIIQHVPETRKWLGIPADHTPGYALLFGKPAVKYARTVQRRPGGTTLLSALEG